MFIRVAFCPKKKVRVFLFELIRVCKKCSDGLPLLSQAKVHFHMGKEPTGLSMLWKLMNTTALPIEVLYPTHMSDRGPSLREEGIGWVKSGGYLDLTCGMKGENGTLDALDLYRQSKGFDLSHVTLSTDSYGSFPVYDDKQELLEYKVLEQTSMLNTIRRLVRERKWKLEEAIQFCTANTARFFGFRDKGTVKEGQDADLLVLSEPSSNYGDEDNFLKLEYVFAKGVLLKTPSWVKKDMFEK